MQLETAPSIRAAAGVLTDATDVARVMELHMALGDSQVSSPLSVELRQQALLHAHPRKSAQKAAERLVSRGGGAYILGDPMYPQSLQKELHEPPPILYIEGDSDILRADAVAVIGMRRPTREGFEAASEWASALAREGLAIVSGNAPGIDSAAHAAALHAIGRTVVFPPAAIDQFDPNFAVPRDAPSRMVVVSPFAPGSGTDKWYFVRRNQLVAALCAAAIIVEAGIRGGTWNTVRHLRQLGRQIFVVNLGPAAPHRNAVAQLVAAGALELPAQPGENGLRLVLDAVATHKRRHHHSTADFLAP